ncbi:MAG: NAD+ synthase [bacterium]
MISSLKIALAQVNSTVGDLEGNREAAIRATEQALSQGANLIVFPELFLAGYPPEDLVLKSSFQQDTYDSVQAIIHKFAGDGICGVLPTLWDSRGKLHNAAIVFHRGKIIGEFHKQELPNYGVFDEKRVFHAGRPQKPFELDGVKFGVMICEDMWQPKTTRGLAGYGADILLVVNGSPYDVEKTHRRQGLARERVKESGLPLVYVNTVGGQDELVFDGGSFVVNRDGRTAWQGPRWEEAVSITEWEKERDGWRCLPGPNAGKLAEEEDMYTALVTGLRDYVQKNRFPGLVIGLSGGIDSALSAAIAVDAIGAKQVRSVMMPSRYTSRESLEDSEDCAARLGVVLDTVSIEHAVAAYDVTLKDVFQEMEPDVTEENIQARIRGQILMAISNKFGLMVLTTGNKSEMAVGYTTLYGDMCGGFSVLKDVYKTWVYRLAAWRNSTRPKHGKGPQDQVIPGRILEKAPTAELRENQTDQDSLPPYEELDAILTGLVEEEVSTDTLVSRGHHRDVVNKIQNLLYSAEYKRRQAPPGVKISPKHFGRDRRYPITNRYRDGL